MTDAKTPKRLGELFAQSPALRPNPHRVGTLQWRQAVGDRVAARTRAGKLNGGVLSVAVASAAWAQELSLLSSAILARLRSQGVLVQKLRFVVGTVETTEPAAALPKVQRAPLPSSLQERLAKIDDAELRDAIAEAAAYSLAHKP